VLVLLQRRPIVSIDAVSRGVGMSPPAVVKSLTHLTELEIVRELTGKRRHRLCSYAKYFATLDRGTEPLPP
jgi:predicted transcriptional regulator